MFACFMTICYVCFLVCHGVHNRSLIVCLLHHYLKGWPEPYIYIYIVYIRYFWQGNHQIYGHIRGIYTVLANPDYLPCLPVFQGSNPPYWIALYTRPHSNPASLSDTKPHTSAHATFKHPFNYDTHTPVLNRHTHTYSCF